MARYQLAGTSGHDDRQGRQGCDIRLFIADDHPLILESIHAYRVDAYTYQM